MPADKVLARRAGRNQQYTPLQQSSGVADAGKIPALGDDGRLDATMMPAGIGANTRTATATEAIAAGKFVNEYNNGGTWSMRLADNGNGRPATGFVLAAVANAAVGTLHPLDATNSQLSGLTSGTDYYLGTVGGVIATPLDGADNANAGKIDQKLGKARSATELITDDFDYVVL